MTAWGSRTQAWKIAKKCLSGLLSQSLWNNSLSFMPSGPFAQKHNHPWSSLKFPIQKNKFWTICESFGHNCGHIFLCPKQDLWQSYILQRGQSSLANNVQRYRSSGSWKPRENVARQRVMDPLGNYKLSSAFGSSVHAQTPAVLRGQYWLHRLQLVLLRKNTMKVKPKTSLRKVLLISCSKC